MSWLTGHLVIGIEPTLGPPAQGKVLSDSVDLLFCFETGFR